MSYILKFMLVGESKQNLAIEFWDHKADFITISYIMVDLK